MTLKIACVGEAMVELSLDETGRQAAVGYAGDSLNTAIYLTRNLGADSDVCFCTVLGEDRFSQTMLDYIANEDVNCDLIAKHADRLPGIYAISKGADGDRVFSYWRESSAARTLFTNGSGAPDFSQLNAMDVVYLSAITMAILPDNVVSGFFQWAKGYQAQGGRIAFDSNYRPKLWPSADKARSVIEQAWRLSDIGLPSIDDEMMLFEDASEAAALERIASYNIPIAAIKRGEDGPLAMIKGVLENNDIMFPKAEIIVDTTSAGDSFNGAFLAAYLTGQTMEKSMLSGHNMAVKVIAHQGAIIDKDVI